MGADFKTPRGVPDVKDVVLNFIGDEATQSAALRTGEVDISYPLSNDGAKALWAEGFKEIKSPGTSTRHFFIDVNTPPTDNKLVRQAFQYAVDVDTMIKALFDGNANPDAQLIGAEVVGFNPDLKPYPYDLDKARALMAEAGQSEGFKLPMTLIPVPGAKDTGEAVAQALGDINVEFDIEILEVGVWVGEYYGPQENRDGLWFEVINWDQTFEPNSTWRWYSSDIGIDNGRRWENQEFDDFYQKAKSTFDKDERAAIYREAGELLYEESPALYLWQQLAVGAMKENVSFDPGLFAANWLGSLVLDD